MNEAQVFELFDRTIDGGAADPVEFGVNLQCGDRAVAVREQVDDPLPGNAAAQAGPARTLAFPTGRRWPRLGSRVIRFLLP